MRTFDLRYYGGPSIVFTIGLVLAFILALVGSILIYLVFLNSNNEHKYKGFLKWLYEFLSFKKLLLEPILKVTYLFLTIYITISGLFTFFISPLRGITLIIVGNVFARIAYEISLMLVMICKNTTQINKALNPSTNTKNLNPTTGSNTNNKEATSVNASDGFDSDGFFPDNTTSQFLTPSNLNKSEIPLEKASTSTTQCCNSCGEPFQEGALFCTNCGQKRI